MKLSYDLHIHSCLSPCADNDMTPNNIVNMSLIKGLDIIAVCDHNSCGNIRAVTEAAAGRISVVPALEVETSEEVHVVCYFPDIPSAEKMWECVRSSMPKIDNNAEIFGNQYYMDSEDNITGEENVLLVNASGMDIYEVFSAAKKFGGAAVPAHIDRSSYSVLSNLGFIPPDLDIKSVEITAANLEKMQADYAHMNILTNSDAHYLENISEAENYINLTSKTPKDLIDFLCKTEVK